MDLLIPTLFPLVEKLVVIFIAFPHNTLPQQRVGNLKKNRSMSLRPPSAWGTAASLLLFTHFPINSASSRPFASDLTPEGLFAERLRPPLISCAPVILWAVGNRTSPIVYYPTSCPFFISNRKSSFGTIVKSSFGTSIQGLPDAISGSSYGSRLGCILQYLVLLLRDQLRYYEN